MPKSLFRILSALLFIGGLSAFEAFQYSQVTIQRTLVVDKEKKEATERLLVRSDCHTGNDFFFHEPFAKAFDQGEQNALWKKCIEKLLVRNPRFDIGMVPDTIIFPDPIVLSIVGSEGWEVYHVIDCDGMNTPTVSTSGHIYLLKRSIESR